MNLARQASGVMLRQRAHALHNRIFSKVYLHGFDLLITIATGDGLHVNDSRNVVLLSKSEVGVRHQDLGTWEYSKPIQSLKVNWSP